MKPKPTTIYCLKNPIDRNRIFYVGRTTSKLNIRLLGHIHHPTNKRMELILKSIRESGKRPTIHIIEICEGYLKPMIKERYWVKHYNKRQYKLANAPFSSKVIRRQDRVYW